MTTQGAPFAQNESEYAYLLARLEESVALRSQLPDDPFRIDGQIDVCQFTWALSGEFGSVLAKLVDEAQDQEVWGMALKPDPIGYYRSLYGIFPAFTLSGADVSWESYWRTISFEPEDDPTGAIAYTADVIALCGSRGTWAVWADRRWDLTLIASPIMNRSWRSVEIPFVSARQALDWFTEPDFASPLPDATREAFLQMIKQRAERS